MDLGELAMMFRNYIFDWSGTLVDDLGPVLEATAAVMGQYGLAPLEREEFRRRFRLPYRDFYEEILPGVPLEELEGHFRAAFSASQVPVTILPHAREKLEWCREVGVRAFVLTSMDERAFHQQLEGLGLSDFFEATYAGVLDKREKIGQLLSDHRLDPRESVFVGDMTHDVETARHAGMTSVAVLTGYTHAGPLSESRPDLMVPDLQVLRELVSRSWAGWWRPVATVGALLHDGRGKVLMVRTHKWGGKWGIPGGKIERGEAAVEALRREMLEETGLELTRVRFAMVQDCIDSTEFLRREHFLLLNYVAKGEGTEVVLNDEAEEYRWLTPAEAWGLSLNQPTRILLGEAMKQGWIEEGVEG